jgi:L-amino acid N-acyltransferase YncA
LLSKGGDASMSAQRPTQAAQAFGLGPAKPADREALIAMYQSFEPKGAALGLPPRHNIERWLDRLSAYPNFLMFAEGNVVGHAVLCPVSDSAEAAVFVHQDYRGLGLGRKLLGALLDEARQRGLHRVWGVLDPCNVAMRRLARSLGFLPGKNPGEFWLEVEHSEHVPAAVAPGDLKEFWKKGQDHGWLL